MNVQEFQEQFMDGDWVNYGDDCVSVHQGPQEVDHKMVSQTSVYQVGNQYFEVTTQKDNTGYWSDGESYDPYVCEVKPVKKVVEIIEWAAA